MSSTLRLVLFVVALLTTAVTAGIFVRGCVAIYRTVRRGQAAPGRLTPVGARLGRMVGEVLSHRRFAGNRWVRAAHWFVMLSFPVLVLTLVASYGQIVDPTFALPGIGHLIPYEWLTEVFAWGGLIGIVGLMIRRAVQRPRGADDGAAARGGDPATKSGPESTADGGEGAATARRSRFFGSNAAQAIYVEWTILGVVVCVLLLRGLEYALAAQLPVGAHLASAWHFPLTSWFGASWVPVARPSLETAIVVIALVKIAISLAWFAVVGLSPAMGVAWHRFLAILNSYARRELDSSPALGALAPLTVKGEEVDFEQIEDLDEDAVLGVGAAQDVTWKGLLDASTCTECGRCQTACPAWITGKPLSPKLLVMSVRDEAFAGHWDSPLIGGAIDPDVLWSCTTCGACVQECPVDIEHVDLIGDLRREQVMMQSEFPAELAPTYRSLENQSNPFSAPARGRMEWAASVDFEVPVIGRDVTDASEVDYVLWVGCAGAFDEKGKVTTRAVAELLQVAGVRFAVLGEAEGCNGDPARRTGNELLFQLLAGAAIEQLNEAKATRILVQCAHCFNTFANEYPQLGGTYEVVHHTQLLNSLVREGRLTPVPPANPEREIAYHDPCYLGRHNQVYAPPRELLEATGEKVVEMPRNRERALCCGAGGGRAFIEETIGTRIATERVSEAASVGADVIATACPFCTTMLATGSADGAGAGGHSGADGAVPADGAAPEVRDVATLLLAAVKRGQADSAE